MSEADLIATIQGRFTPTPQIALGLAFGKVLEDPHRYQVPGGYRLTVYGETFCFDDEMMAEPLAIADRRGTFEAKAVTRYGDCEVVCKADHLLGAQLSEFKTTTGTFDFDKYAPSCQWRFMADAFRPALITYHVFLLEDHGNSVINLRGIESFNLYPYPALHQDCCDLLERFCTYVRAKGLDALLRQRQVEAA